MTEFASEPSSCVVGTLCDEDAKRGNQNQLFSGKMFYFNITA